MTSLERAPPDSRGRHQTAARQGGPRSGTPGQATDRPGDDASPNGGVSAIFIRRPITTFMMMAGLLIIGLVAYLNLPIASLPTVDVENIMVTAEM